MFDEENTNQHRLSSLEAIREAALIAYGRFISHTYGKSPADAEYRTRHKYLSLQEVESIVKEHCHFADTGVYAIGGDSADEANKNINALMAALMDRVMSNVLQEGVRDGLIDCSYDTDRDDFAFSVTNKGKKIVSEIRQNRENANRSDIPRD